MGAGCTWSIVQLVVQREERCGKQGLGKRPLASSSVCGSEVWEGKAQENVTVSQPEDQEIKSQSGEWTHKKGENYTGK